MLCFSSITTFIVSASFQRVMKAEEVPALSALFIIPAFAD
jgi:urea transporter